MSTVRHPWPSGYLRGEPSVIAAMQRKPQVQKRGPGIDLTPKQSQLHLPAKRNKGAA